MRSQSKALSLLLVIPLRIHRPVALPHTRLEVTPAKGIIFRKSRASVKSARTNTTSGTLTTTREVAKLYTIANLLAACVNSNGSTATGTNCGTLFTNTSDGNGTPADTLQAAVQMALFPYKNVSALFALQTATPPFAGGLGSTPHDWSLAISYTSTAFNLSVLSSSTYLTTSNIDIDASGNIWFPTNSATSHGIGRFSPFTGSPSFSGPYLTNLIRPQYLAITNQGRIYATDTASPQVAYTSTAVPNATAAATYTDSSSGYSGNTGPSSPQKAALERMAMTSSSPPAATRPPSAPLPTVSATPATPPASTASSSPPSQW